MADTDLSPLTIAIAAHIRAAMASRTPAWKPRDLERATGMAQSTISRLLTPKQVMNVVQLDEICRALGLDTGTVIDSARKVVAEHEADRLRARIKRAEDGDAADNQQAG